MTSRVPPSRRDPEYAEKQIARAIRQRTPGTGRVPQAAPTVSGDVAAMLRGKATGTGGGPVLHVGPNPPTDGSVLWFDTDATC